MTPKIQFDLSSFDRRRLIIVLISLVVIVAAIVGMILFLTGTGGEKVSTAASTPTGTARATPSLAPSPSSPPTDTPSPAPTPTLEPYSYTVQAGDTMYAIIQLFGYRELSIVPEILALNGMADENDLLVGQVLLIPRQTPTPGPTFTPSPTLGLGTPTQAEVTQTTAPQPDVTLDYTGCSPENRCISPDGYWIHEVRPNDTIAQIAYQYDAQISCVLAANGLPDDPIIFEGQKIKVCIQVTLTPTLTPTGGPDSTATPTPTLAPPSLLAPNDEARIPRNQNVILQWVAVHPLHDDQHYLIVLRNLGSGETSRFTTRGNIYRLPADLRPGVGQSTQFEWQVVIIGGDSIDLPVMSGQGEKWIFTWGT